MRSVRQVSGLPWTRTRSSDRSKQLFLSRKTSERIALDSNKNVRNLQHFIGQSPWRKEPVLMIHQRLIAETLGEVDGVMLIDESGVVKQGRNSMGASLKIHTIMRPAVVR